MSEEPGRIKVTPTVGTRAFRNRTSLAVQDGMLIVRDRKGTERRFPLNAGPSSPSRRVIILPNIDGAFRDQWAILDGNDEAIALGYVGDWDAVERAEIDRPAGLTPGIENRDAPRAEVREDGLILEDGTWWKRAPHAGSVALVIAFATVAGALPAALGWPVVIALMAFLVIGMTSGAYGKARRGKGAAVEDAIISGDEDAYEKAVDDLDRNSPKATDPDSPESAT
jgi:hypothetical protein